jgi:hypothetical protein
MTITYLYVNVGEEYVYWLTSQETIPLPYTSGTSSSNDVHENYED